MKKSIKATALWCLAALAVTSCGKDASFDKGNYDNLVKKAFGIEALDAAQQWATVRTVTVSTTINLTEDDSYQMAAYLHNPIPSTTSVAVLQEEMTNGRTLVRSVACPTTATQLFVQLTNSSGERRVKAVPLQDGMATCTFTDADEKRAFDGVINTEPFSLRYCFEQDFPDVGDYDFNDVVLSVMPTVSGTTLTLNVRLDAVGASKTVAAAVRLAGVTSSMLTSYRVNRGFASPEGLGMGTYNNIEGDKTILAGNEHPNYTDDMVVVLFKDAHWAMNPVKSSTGGVMQIYYNTVPAGSTGEVSYLNVEAPQAVYTFEFKDAVQARSMLRPELYDVFIVESFNGAYWETHTVQNGYKTSQVLTPFKDGAYEAAYGDNMPWALLVPGTFRYPIEGRHITTAYGTASHSFAEWAANSNMAADWYESPVLRYVFNN